MSGNNWVLARAAQGVESSSESDEEEECPLCMEPLEPDDRNFFPCTCGYQVCRFCWHRIRNDENGLCPACRKAYSDKPAEYNPVTMEELQKMKQEKKQRKALKKQKEIEMRKALANVRVVQKNLVYVIGLPHRVGNEENLLRKHEYFGQYGKILKIVVNRNNHYNSGPNPTVSAYITFAKNEDAGNCVRAIDKSSLDGRVLRASLGTTKYCSNFLRGMACPNPDCMYLHELGDDAASYTKQDMLDGKHSADSVHGAAKPLRGFGNVDPAAHLPEASDNQGSEQESNSSSAHPGRQSPSWKSSGSPKESAERQPTVSTTNGNPVVSKSPARPQQPIMTQTVADQQLSQLQLQPPHNRIPQALPQMDKLHLSQQQQHKSIPQQPPGQWNGPAQALPGGLPHTNLPFSNLGGPLTPMSPSKHMNTPIGIDPAIVDVGMQPPPPTQGQAMVDMSSMFNWQTAPFRQANIGAANASHHGGHAAVINPGKLNSKHEADNDLDFDPWVEMTKELSLDDGLSAGWAQDTDPEPPSSRATSRFAFAQSEPEKSTASKPDTKPPPTTTPPLASQSLPPFSSTSAASNIPNDKWQEQMRTLFPGVNISFGSGQQATQATQHTNQQTNQQTNQRPKTTSQHMTGRSAQNSTSTTRTSGSQSGNRPRHGRGRGVASLLSPLPPFSGNDNLLRDPILPPSGFQGSAGSAVTASGPPYRGSQAPTLHGILGPPAPDLPPLGDLNGISPDVTPQTQTTQQYDVRGGTFIRWNFFEIGLIDLRVRASSLDSYIKHSQPFLTITTSFFST
eukprot:m.244593 g.244593  ORF g.244593 m.244593 type:complete len:792 (-) comp16105_c0_seq21:70-2445(-)